MLRTPPRRHPRVAALVSSRRTYVLVVLDAWEVRCVAITRSCISLRRVLLRERPVLVAAAKVPAWLRRMNVRVIQMPLPRATKDAASSPTLRRFAGLPHEAAVRGAVALANQALTNLAYDQPIPQD